MSIKSCVSKKYFFCTSEKLGPCFLKAFFVGSLNNLLDWHDLYCDHLQLYIFNNDKKEISF